MPFPPTLPADPVVGAGDPVSDFIQLRDGVADTVGEVERQETAHAKDADLTGHTGSTEGVHGIVDTAALVLTDDARLSDARVPVSHGHPVGQISGLEAYPSAAGQAAGLVAETVGDGTWQLIATPTGGGGGGSTNPMLQVGNMVTVIRNATTDQWEFPGGTVPTFTGRTAAIMWECTSATVPAQGVGDADFKVGDKFAKRDTEYAS